MSSESKRTPIPGHHIVSEFPELEDRQFLRESMEACYNGRAIYREPQLPENYARQALMKTGRQDILVNRMIPDIDRTIAATPSYLVPTSNLLLYGKAVREALLLYAEKVLVPKGELTREGITDYVKGRMHYVLKHEREHARKLPEDASQKGVQSYFKVGFYTACEMVEGRSKDGIGVHVEERLAPSMLIMDDSNALSKGDMINIVTAPGEEMSDGDKRLLDQLRERLEGLQE